MPFFNIEKRGSIVTQAGVEAPESLWLCNTTPGQYVCVCVCHLWSKSKFLYLNQIKRLLVFTKNVSLRTLSTRAFIRDTQLKLFLVYNIFFIDICVFFFFFFFLCERIITLLVSAWGRKARCFALFSYSLFKYKGIKTRNTNSIGVLLKKNFSFLFLYFYAYLLFHFIISSSIIWI